MLFVLGCLPSDRYGVFTYQVRPLASDPNKLWASFMIFESYGPGINNFDSVQWHTAHIHLDTAQVEPLERLLDDDNGFLSYPNSSDYTIVNSLPPLTSEPIGGEDYNPGYSLAVMDWPVARLQADDNNSGEFCEFRFQTPDGKDLVLDPGKYVYSDPSDYNNYFRMDYFYSPKLNLHFIETRPNERAPSVWTVLDIATTGGGGGGGSCNVQRSVGETITYGTLSAIYEDSHLLKLEGGCGNTYALYHEKGVTILTSDSNFGPFGFDKSIRAIDIENGVVEPTGITIQEGFYYNEDSSVCYPAPKEIGDYTLCPYLSTNVTLREISLNPQDERPGDILREIVLTQAYLMETFDFQLAPNVTLQSLFESSTVATSSSSAAADPRFLGKKFTVSVTAGIPVWLCLLSTVFL